MKKTEIVGAILAIFAMLLCGCEEKPVFSTDLPPEATYTPIKPSVPALSETDPVATEQLIQSIPFIELEPMTPAETITEIELFDAGEELPSLPMIFTERPYYEPALYIMGIFFSDLSGDFMYYLDEGQLHQIDMTPATTTVNHKGEEYEIGYLWCGYDGNLAVRKKGGSSGYTIVTIADSSRYVALRFDGWDKIIDEYTSHRGYYTYLLDVETGVVSDPLAQLGEENWPGMSGATFSPDGQYAVVTYRSKNSLLLNCWNGDIFEIPVSDSVKEVEVSFIDSTQMLICYTKEVTNSVKQWVLYDLQTGECVDCTEYFVLYGRSSDVSVVKKHETLYYIGIPGDAWNKIYITDLAEQKIVYLKTENEGRTKTFPCADGNIGVIHENVVYVVDMDAGTMTPMLRIEDVAQ